MRVFPLEKREEKRIVLSYTQKLPGLYGRATYRFPAGHSLNEVRDWSFHARIKNGAKLEWTCDSHALKPMVKDGDLLLDAAANKVKMDRDVVLDAQTPLAGWYATHGFVPDGEEFLEDGIPHTPMRLPR